MLEKKNKKKNMSRFNDWSYGLITASWEDLLNDVETEVPDKNKLFQLKQHFNLHLFWHFRNDVRAEWISVADHLKKKLTS